MNTQRVWNPRKIHDYSAAWLQAGTGEVGTRAEVDRLRDYVSGTGEWNNVAMEALTLETWNYRKGTVLLWNGDIDGLQMLHMAACAALVVVDLYFHNKATKPLAEQKAVVEIGDLAFAFATFTSLGAVADAHVAFECMLSGLHAGRMFALESYLYPRYLLEMYAAWKGAELSLEGVGLRSARAYDDLLAVWDTADLPVLKAAVDAACDFHIARSRAATSSVTYDFEYDWTRVFPAEILSLLRLRELKGLQNPEMDHRLMVLPTARLYPVQHFEWDPILLAAYRKAILEVQTPKPAPKKPWWRIFSP